MATADSARFRPMNLKFALYASPAYGRIISQLCYHHPLLMHFFICFIIQHKGVLVVTFFGIYSDKNTGNLKRKQIIYLGNIAPQDNFYLKLNIFSSLIKPFQCHLILIVSLNIPFNSIRSSKQIYLPILSINSINFSIQIVFGNPPLFHFSYNK